MCGCKGIFYCYNHNKENRIQDKKKITFQVSVIMMITTDCYFLPRSNSLYFVVGRKTDLVVKIIQGLFKRISRDVIMIQDIERTVCNALTQKV